LTILLDPGGFCEILFNEISIAFQCQHGKLPKNTIRDNKRRKRRTIVFNLNNFAYCLFVARQVAQIQLYLYLCTGILKKGVKFPLNQQNLTSATE